MRDLQLHPGVGGGRPLHRPALREGARQGRPLPGHEGLRRMPALWHRYRAAGRIIYKIIFFKNIIVVDIVNSKLNAVYVSNGTKGLKRSGVLNVNYAKKNTGFLFA